MLPKNNSSIISGYVWRLERELFRRLQQYQDDNELKQSLVDN